MEHFKIGDKVRCLYSAGMYPLEKDGIYTIRKVVYDGKYATIDFEDVEDKGWFVDNFELVQTSEEKPEVIKEQKTMFKIGDKVRCVDASCTWGELSEGAVYTVKNYYFKHSKSNPHIQLFETDTGWLSNRFELIQSEEEATESPNQITLDLTNEQIQYLVQFALERILTERMNQEKINQAQV